MKNKYHPEIPAIDLQCSENKDFYTFEIAACLHTKDGAVTGVKTFLGCHPELHRDKGNSSRYRFTRYDVGMFDTPCILRITKHRRSREYDFRVLSIDRKEEYTPPHAECVFNFVPIIWARSGNVLRWLGEALNMEFDTPANLLEWKRQKNDKPEHKINGVTVRVHTNEGITYVYKGHNEIPEEVFTPAFFAYMGHKDSIRHSATIAEQ